MLKFNKSVLAVLIVTLTAVAFGQSALEKNKPIDQWTQKEATEILNNSAWVRTYQSNEGAAAAAAAGARRQQSDNRLVGSERSRSDLTGAPPPIVMRLYSGLPIRLAIARLRQIAAGYEKMNDKAKAEFNQANKMLLECPACKNNYVVSLTQIPNPSGEFVEEAIFEGMTLDQMKGNAWLRNDKGEKRELIHFIAPAKRGDSAMFFFARNDDKGNAFLTKDNSEFSFVFDGNFFTSKNRFAYLIPRQFDFKVSKITVADTLVF
ncbi:MAG TPA: hypothetical protein VNA17_00125 [Pyrinomonadaceae bacterium]|nr:hypothetical protein [Pyrinomonadaceae bacterium]